MRPRIVVLTLALTAGCTSTKFAGQCQQDGDCPLGSFCRADKLCVCRPGQNEACGAGKFCNTQGVCQDVEGCRANSDCAMTEFCDLASGHCIPKTNCARDVHCALGTVCKPGGDTCVPGCVDEGDCPLYSICQKTAGTSTSVLGVCQANRCIDKSYCPYGQRCNNQSCMPDPNPNHCAPCNNMRGDCGAAANFCLVNSNYDPNNPRNGSQFFCGVSCASEADCPNGYQCGGVVLLTQDQCTQDVQCGAGRHCRIQEGQARGFCDCNADPDCSLGRLPPRCAGSCGGLGALPCMNDNECATTCVHQCQSPMGRMCTQDSECDPLSLCAPLGPGGSRVCITTGMPCQIDDECLCSNGSCVGTGRGCRTAMDCHLSCVDHGCLLGMACAPIEGLGCPDVR